ncbi:VOC family protein [Algoriphagus sp. H41]|uniref:VOC family protein n=1 Tax=Algoriphagus oliviformis TaxID=2811231 RepID=A0ABS3C6M9_9BACT|nr:VOC family protein [Algoriphagus oliviformis]MBN7811254.1 VOC family protein [Algoriphagus oliviformis]
MRIEHLAIWVNDLEKMRAFYLDFFHLTSNEKYYNPKKEFSSYFLTFPSGARIELMHRPEVTGFLNQDKANFGLAHFAVSVGSKEQVDELTDRLRNSGYRIVGEPRTTGDGYYESVISDPEGNLVEITI